MNQTRSLLTMLCCASLVSACGTETPPAPPAAPAAPPPVSDAMKAPPAPPPVAVVPKPDPDKSLAAKVKEALEKAIGAAATRIDVTVKGGGVTLWGSVDDEKEKARIADIARKVAGVDSVENKLQVVTGS